MGIPPPPGHGVADLLEQQTGASCEEVYVALKLFSHLSGEVIYGR